MKLLCILLAAFRFLVSSPGEDAAREAGFNWHCSEPGSVLELTVATDPSFKNARTVAPEETFWSLKDHEPSLDVWSEYICRARVDGLRPDKEYIYRVRLGRETSQAGRLRTAPRGGSKPWKFVAFIDLQPSFNKNSYPLLSALDSLVGGEAVLSVCSGDYTDHGWAQEEWEWALGHPFFRNHPHAGTPGDHEYWGHKKPDGHIWMMQTPAGYNTMFCNPANGIPECRNSNFWFLWGGVLFAGLDTGDSNTSIDSTYNAQAQWLKELAASLKGRYNHFVVFGHKSVYGSDNTDSGVAKNMRPLWTEAFAEAGVDLFIGGHDHKYSRTGNVGGTWYLDMGSSGSKYRVPEEEMYSDGIHEKVLDLKATGDCAAAVVTVTEKSLTVEVRSALGELLDSFSL